MSDKPILFSAPMVRAILREVEAPGTGKTQTRRVLTPAKLRSGTLPSIHMPRSFSRLTLIVTDVRVQRLHDISEADAMAEGVIFNAGLPADVHRHCIPIGDGEVISGWDARECFSQLWDHINSPGAWQANPWVVAYSFRPILDNHRRRPPRARRRKGGVSEQDRDA